MVGAPDTRPRRLAQGMRIAVIGGGWAGLAAAVRAVQLGHRVTLLEMASTLGGRARTVAQRGVRHDNGQHILIGAYTHTLDLMRAVGVDPAAALDRSPLCLMEPDGRGLALTTTSLRSVEAAGSSRYTVAVEPGFTSTSFLTVA